MSSLSARERASALRPLFDASGVGERRGAGGEERRRGGRCRRRGGRPTPFALCRAYRQKQNVPATLAIGCASIGRPPLRLHPSSPPLLSSRSPPLAYPTRVEKWTQHAGLFARREGAHGSRPLSAPPYSREMGAHEDEGWAGPSPCLTDPPHSRGPAAPPPFPPTSALSARKEDTSPLPCPHRPIRVERVCMRDSVPTPVPFSAGDACPAPRAPPRPARIARGGTVRHPLRAGHASPTPAPPCPRTQEDGWRVQPHPRAQGRDSAHSPVLLGAGHASPAARARKGEGRRVHPLLPLLRLLRTPPRPRTPGDKRVGAPSPAPSARYPSPSRVSRRAQRRGACKGEGRTHARGYTERGTSASGERRSRARRGGAELERNPGGGAAHERKGGHIGARVLK
ncbi:hypothetical protein EDB84DRAFT_1679165 [Lactarius hengduanensis]|nr:hypothetical protein EDB84DRAFT_1679165 [Lactarius hengduanensis]